MNHPIHSELIRIGDNTTGPESIIIVSVVIPGSAKPVGLALEGAGEGNSKSESAQRNLRTIRESSNHIASRDNNLNAFKVVSPRHLDSSIVREVTALHHEDISSIEGKSNISSARNHRARRRGETFSKSGLNF